MNSRNVHESIQRDLFSWYTQLVLQLPLRRSSHAYRIHQPLFPALLMGKHTQLLFSYHLGRERQRVGATRIGPHGRESNFLVCSFL